MCIEHYRYNNVLKFRTFFWHNELIRVKNESDEKTGVRIIYRLTVFLIFQFSICPRLITILL